VTFERELEESEGAGGEFKRVKRTLFGRMNPYPQKKIMTFNKHVKDFRFTVHYQDLEYLGETEVARVGSTNVSSALVKGVAAALEKNKDVETKGVKAHFTLDDSGILTCTQVESVFEKTISVEEQEALEAKEEGEEKAKDDTWSKLGDTISQFFTTDEDKDKEKADDKDAKPEDKKKLKDEKKKKEAEKEKKAKEEKKKKEEKEKKAKEPKKPKIETIKEELAFSAERHDLPEWTAEVMAASRDKLDILDKADQDRVARETALNELQSFTFDLNDKLEQDEYIAASTEEERTKMREVCSVVSDWLDEEAGPLTELKELNSRMKELKDVSSALFARVREHKERPEALEQLEKSILNSREFLEKSRNLTGEDGYFKEKELENMEKKIVEVEKWRDDKLAEQKDHPLSEMPKLTVGMIIPKISDIDNEVKYMVQKAKMVKAERERAKRLKEAEEKKAEEEAKKAEKKKKKSKKTGEAEGGEADSANSTTDETEDTAQKPSDTTEEKPETTETPETEAETPETETPAATNNEESPPESESSDDKKDEEEVEPEEKGSSDHNEL